MGSKRGAIPCHSSSQAHKEAELKALSFKSIVCGSTNVIRSSLSAAYKRQLEEKQAILLSIIDIIIALGQRNIPFRGHNWDKETKREDGNFDFFVHWKANFDPVLKQHIQGYKKNASYLSPTIQNQLIELLVMK